MEGSVGLVVPLYTPCLRSLNAQMLQIIATKATLRNIRSSCTPGVESEEKRNALEYNGDTIALEQVLKLYTLHLNHCRKSFLENRKLIVMPAECIFLAVLE